MLCMGINISNIAPKAEKLFNSKGYRLVSKKFGVKLKQNILMDVVSIEGDFGKTQKKIITLKDNDGKLLKRYFLKTGENKPAEKVVKKYTIDNDSGVRQVISEHFQNGKLIKDVKEVFSLKKISEKVNNLFKAKLETTPLSKGIRHERQRFENFNNIGKQNQYIETTAINNHGLLKNKTIEGNIPNLKEFQTDPYIFRVNYTNRDFTQSVVPKAIKEQGISDVKFDIYDVSMKDDLGLSKRNKVLIDSEKHDNKLELLDTIYHEFRHKYQTKIDGKIYYKVGPYYFGKRKNCKLPQEQIKYGEKVHEAATHYVQPSTDVDAYYNNFLEKDARQSGEKARNILKNTYKKLMSSFSNSNPAAIRYM